ncbi:Lsr2 family protein [Nocardiopsis ansamitocini]|uniref:Lsr2 family protein n=2 Tax=Nocardiopsis ansamitocini TaxID=1670832 RepID=A0A9W6P4J3_9ACTN|nr:Lsr2 family protein [Nocardiopsis ansamitocini]
MLIDDLDGDEAQETVSFGIDGTGYEIDLKTQNASRLRDALAPFVHAARKVPAKPGRMVRGAKSRNAPTREHSADIRSWAQANDKPVSDRGRIPQTIVDEYNAAHG